MKRIKLIIILCAAVLQLSAQNSETRKLASFKEISVSQGIDAILQQGSSESVRIEVEGIDLDEVLTEVDGGTLRIHLDGNNHRNTDVTVYVTYVSLSGLKASSAASITGRDKIVCDCDFELDVSSAGDIDVRLKSSRLKMEASSAGDLEVTVETGSIEASVSSAGDIDIEGTAKKVEVKASSSGDFSGSDLTCNTADLRASSGASIRINVQKEIVARASSGGSISYGGNPEYVDKETSSGGSIKRR